MIAKKSKIWGDIELRYTFIANMLGMMENVDNQKMALQTKQTGNQHGDGHYSLVF